MRRIICFVFIVLIFFSLTGCSSDNSKNLENEKVLSEVVYLENGLVTIFNKYFQDDYILENNENDWTSIDEDFSILKNSIDVILIDLASIQLNNDYILQLQNNFSDIENFILAKDLTNFSKKISEAYRLVSYSILDNISENKEFKLEKKSKSDLISLGYYIKNNNKEESQKYINSFEENISNLSTSKNYIENNSYKINRIFIEFQKLNSEIENDDFEKSKATLTKILDFF